MNTKTQNAPAKILFVDDEENILKSLKRCLMDEPFDILTAPSGKEGLKLLEVHPDLAVIVSDQRMPEMTGTEFLEQSRIMLPDATRILLTGYAEISAVIEAINLGGAYRYLAKPWKDEEIRQVLHDAVNRHTLIIENKRLTTVITRQNEELKQWSGQLEVLVQEQTMDLEKRNKELEHLNVQLRNNFRKTIESFSGLIEMRDRSVSNHSKTVADLARKTAVAMKLSPEEINQVFVASLLHDIGKIGIPDAVLSKSVDSLNDAEKREYQMHPVRGQVVVERLEGFSAMGLLIRHHHENIDGSGFPDHLAMNKIPLGSRIIALADGVDRIANAGGAPDYKKAMTTVEFYLDTRYDRQVYKQLQPFLLYKIQEAVRQDNGIEAEVLAQQLRPGMLLSRDVKSGTGVLLLGRGAILDQQMISGLQRFFAMDPTTSGVFVRK